MSRRAAAALALVLACSVALQPDAIAGSTSPPGSRPTSTTKRLDDQRSRVAEIGERIEDLTSRLTSLIAQLRSLDTQVGQASTGVANATAGLRRAEQRSAATRAILSARAREAYKRGAGWRDLAVLL